MKKMHVIYQVTNKINGRFYVGMHSTFDINDGYFGSGRRIKAEIAKYGLENFEKKILEVLPDRKALELREAEIVDAVLLKNRLCLNLKLGGAGGFDHEKSHATILEKYGSTYFSEIAKLKQPEKREATNAKIAESVKQFNLRNGSPNLGKIREKVTCPHCQKVGAKNTMTRFHFDNCKDLK